MKNKDGIVVWDENVTLSNHGDMKKADVDRIKNGMIGYAHVIHRGTWVEDELRAYTYFFDAMENLDMCSEEEIRQWEVRMNFHNTLQGSYAGSSISFEYNNGPSAWGKDDD